MSQAYKEMFYVQVAEHYKDINRIPAHVGLPPQAAAQFLISLGAPCGLAGPR